MCASCGIGNGHMALVVGGVRSYLSHPLSSIVTQCQGIVVKGIETSVREMLYSRPVVIEEYIV